MDAPKRARGSGAPSLYVKVSELAKLGSRQLSHMIEDTDADAHGTFALEFPPGASGLENVAEYIRATAAGMHEEAREVLRAAVRSGKEGVVNALGFLADKFDIGCITHDMTRVVLDVGTISMIATDDREAFYAKFVRDNPIASRAMFDALCDNNDGVIHHGALAVMVKENVIIIAVCRDNSNDENPGALAGVVMVNWARLGKADTRFLYQFFDENAIVWDDDDEGGDEGGDEDGEEEGEDADGEDGEDDEEEGGGRRTSRPGPTTPYSALLLPSHIETNVWDSWRTWFDADNQDCILEYIAGGEVFHGREDDLPTMCEDAIGDLTVICVLDEDGMLITGRNLLEIRIGGRAGN